MASCGLSSGPAFGCRASTLQQDGTWCPKRPSQRGECSVWIYFAYTFDFRNKRKIMRIFTLPPTVEIPSEPNFYDSVKKIRLRQQLEMYSIARKYDQQQQPQKQTDSVQLLVE
ncbi:PREDICTED: small integral membrane protein 19 [Gekko japonicus]|uniref:Small integral membrane protein 19 n=1 Tax=Gekko japonicus TaxID=146911 RepID=A0ABM1JP28_GEKJA|nr:PREDICTED: small integral membrane protein 19 [Gekko japonicus]